MRAWFPFLPGLEAFGFHGLYVVKLWPLPDGLGTAKVAVEFEAAGVERFRFFEGWVVRVFCRAAQFPEGTNDLEGLLCSATSAVFVVKLMMSFKSGTSAEISSPALKFVNLHQSRTGRDKADWTIATFLASNEASDKSSSRTDIDRCLENVSLTMYATATDGTDNTTE